MKIVITGAAGYIGSSLSKFLYLMGHEVVGFDNMRWNQSDLVAPVFTSGPQLFVEDVRDWSARLEEHIRNAEIIIPLAALVGAPLCDKYREEAKQINKEWIEDLIPRLNNQFVLFPNTNSSYGSNPNICTEESPLNPLSLYAETKQAAEDALIQYPLSICFRLATVFGWSYRPRTDLLVNNLILKAKNDYEVLLYDWNYRRNYIHIKDICRAFTFAIKNRYVMAGNVYNLGNDNINSTKEDLLKKICEYYGSTIRYDDQSTDPDKRDYVVSSKKLYDVGFECIYPLEYGIQEMDRFYTLAGDNERFRNY